MTTSVQAPAEQGAEQEPAEQPAEQPPAPPAAGQTVEVRARRTGFLEFEPGQTTMTPVQRAALAAIGIDNSFDPAHVKAFMHFCQARNLDPWQKEVYLVKRGTGDNAKYATQMSIETFRRKAAATGRFIRRVGWFWTGRDDSDRWWRWDEREQVFRRVYVDTWVHKEPPAVAKCVIEHFDETGNVVRTEGLANWEMFAGTKAYWENGRKAGTELTEMWAKGGPHMLAKCAEVQALRGGFPGEFGGIFSPEEMARADAEASDERMQAFLERRRQAYAEATGQPADGRHPDTDGQQADAAAGEDPDDAVQLPDPDTERGWLASELQVQGQLLGIKPGQLVGRWVAASGTPWDEATLEEKRSMVVGTRELVVMRLRQDGHVDAADAYGAADPIGAPLERLFGGQPPNIDDDSQ